MTTAAQRFYGRWAALYDLVAVHTPGVGGLRDRTVALLDLEPGDTVVEMGCGTGANFPALADRVGPDGRIVGVDFTRPMLERAGQRVRKHGWENVDLVRADASRPPVAGSVDAVLATFVVGMLADPSTAVERWCDLLRPGGRIALLNAARSDRPYGTLVNLPFRLLVLISTPNKGRIRRGDVGQHELLDHRITRGHAALTDRCDDVVHEERALGIVRVSSGTVV